MDAERQQPLSDEIGNGDVPAVPACHLAPALGEETHLIEAARFFRIAAIGGVEAMKRRDERLAGGARERTDDIAVLAEMGMDKIGLADRGKEKRQADLRDFQKQLAGPRNGRPTNVMNRDSRFFVWAEEIREPARISASKERNATAWLRTNAWLAGKNFST